VANRAPNVTELYTPKGGSTLEFNAQDPCGNWAQTQPWGNVAGNPNRINLQTLCQQLMVRDGAPPSLYVPGASANSWAYNVFGFGFNFPFSIGVTEGNPGLDSEEAETYTFGFVIGFDRMTLAVDWYDIDLTGAIDTPAFATIYQQCLDPTYNPLIASAQGTYTGPQLAAGNPYCGLINREYIQGAPTPQQGATGAARTFDARYINLGGISSDGVRGAVFGVSSHDQLDLFSRWSFGERYELRAGIDNLTNEDPEVVGATTANNALGSTSTDYDTFGRRVFLGLSIGF
jgi:outer membrane receptor protein involved in Fe transport